MLYMLFFNLIIFLLSWHIYYHGNRKEKTKAIALKNALLLLNYIAMLYVMACCIV